MKIVVLMASLVLPCCVQAQTALVARISERTQAATSDLKTVVWLDADTSYWVVGCDKGKFQVFHASGSKVSLPRDVRYRIIERGKYDDTTNLQISAEKTGIDRYKGRAIYEATLANLPDDVFVAVQLYANNEPLVAEVSQVHDKHVFVDVQFRDVSEDAKLTYAAHYFINGNEVRQVKPSVDW